MVLSTETAPKKVPRAFISAFFESSEGKRQSDTKKTWQDGQDKIKVAKTGYNETFSGPFHCTKSARSTVHVPVQIPEAEASPR